MRSERATFGGYYLAFVGLGLATALLVVAIGYFPTVRLRGGSGASAAIIGCGVSWIASCFGALPTAAALSSRPGQAGAAVLASTLVRFVTVLALLTPLILSEWFDKTILVLFAAISYLMMLLVDTLLAVRIIQRAGEKTG